MREGDTADVVSVTEECVGVIEIRRATGGALLGLAVGDALGTTLAFSIPGRFEPSTTWRAASDSVSLPVPQPTSRTREPLARPPRKMAASTSTAG